jgi:glycosyltransferase involved in cell wall biosynthesis
VRVAFLVNDLQLSGGVGVVVQHARRLSALDGWEVSLVLVRDQEDASWAGYTQLPHLHVRTRAEAIAEHYDVAVATWWETTFTLFELSADRYAYFIQSLEDRFYLHDEAERLGAALTLDLPVAFITEAAWIAETIGALRPDAQCHLVRNGIDKQVFAPLDGAPPRREAPLRVLVEGSPRVWFKGVKTAIAAAEAMREPHHLTVVTAEHAALADAAVDDVVGPLSHAQMAELYDRTDVLLKLSSVEGMFGPPLEAFHRGATCVVTPVTGHDEYVTHGWNGLLTDWDDVRGTARQLDLLARNVELLRFLQTNALETARAWPSWDQTSPQMAQALLAIRREPPPLAATARLLADLRAGIELHGKLLRERIGFYEQVVRLERIRRSPPVRLLRRLRNSRKLKRLARPLRPLYRRARGIR